MDLNMKNLLSLESLNCSKNDDIGDTTLCLNCLGYGTHMTSKIGVSPLNHEIHDKLSSQDDGCRLVLGLGPTPGSYCNDYHSFGSLKSNGSSTLPCQNLVSDAEPEMLKLGLSRGTGEPVSSMAPGNLNSLDLENQIPTSNEGLHFPVVDEGSTSAKRKSGGYMTNLLLAPRLERETGSKGMPETWELLDLQTNLSTNHDHRHQLQSSPDPSATTDCSVGATSNATVAGAVSDRRTNQHHLKKCRFKGCSKGARGASGLCIAHGGGQRCQKPGCNKGAESRTAYCKAHGGGRRCEQLGCTKSAEGKTDHCIAHGGGRRCCHQGCTKAARGKSGLCIRHGGGKRCTVEGCTRSAEGQAGLCISHGGGRRCQIAGCGKGAQGSTMYCKAHGGGKRCIFEGCTRGAEGSTPLCKGHGGGKRCLHDGGGVCPKSVHGGTDYCVAHGGGKRCAVPGCTKSARGRTDCCVKHGGGKRCKFVGCGKSAQGSTDLCKAHGGGKRCTWGQGCEKFARGKSGLCAAHGSMMAAQQDQQTGNGSSMISPGLFHGLVSVSTTTGESSTDNEYSSSEVSAISDCVQSSEDVGRRQLLIPPQVLVPPTMKSPSTSSGPVGVERDGGSKGRSLPGFVVPEGRVHGGGLMSLFGGNLKNALNIGRDL